MTIVQCSKCQSFPCNCPMFTYTPVMSLEQQISCLSYGLGLAIGTLKTLEASAHNPPDRAHLAATIKELKGIADLQFLATTVQK